MVHLVSYPGLNDYNETLTEIVRNNVTDPTAGRVTTATDTFDGANTVYTLTNPKVRAITSVTVSGAKKYKWTDYTVSYGLGDTGTTVITFYSTTPAGTGTVVIVYLYGQSLANLGFARDNATRPKISMIPLTDAQIQRYVGENYGPTGVYFSLYQKSWSLEVRSDYALQCRTLMATLVNAINGIRHAGQMPYGVWDIWVGDVVDYDYNMDLKSYSQTCTVKMKVVVPFSASVAT
jgi:hypothetical protein